MELLFFALLSVVNNSATNPEPETTFTDCIFAFTRYQEENNMSTNVLPDTGYICQMYYDDHGRYPNYNDLFSGDKSLFGGIIPKLKEIR